MPAETPMTSGSGPASECGTVIFFEGRDLLTVGVQELVACQFQNEVSSEMIESNSVYTFRVEATRWHNSASNQERFLYLLKTLVTELSSVESTTGQDANTIIPTLHFKKASWLVRGRHWLNFARKWLTVRPG